MRSLAPTALCVLAALAPLAACADGSDFSGQVRSYGVYRQTANTGPLAQANTLQPGIASVEGSTHTVQFEMRGHAALGPVSLRASATLEAQQGGAQSGNTQGRFNEAYASGSTAAGWQWSAGKRVVSWDVGYGFRPNDLVQQEQRRTLVSQPLQGRPVLMAEQFGAESAWSLVAVNPTTGRDAPGAGESALADKAPGVLLQVGGHEALHPPREAGAARAQANGWARRPRQESGQAGAVDGAGRSGQDFCVESIY